VPGEHTYDYAIIRVVPRVERGELINVGVILSCPAADFLDARIELGALAQRSRFHWLVSPRSTIIQMSPVHTGRTDDPEKTLQHLLDTMVR
jgi:hypothetical protein